MLQGTQILNRMEMVEQSDIQVETEVSHQEESQHCHSQDESFEWDENSQLYYHARSGFYHDPNAGWYYSTKDGLYYKFEDGNYILLDSHKGDQSEIKGEDASVLCGTATCEQDYGHNNYQNQGEADQTDFQEFITSEVPENPPPPSEW